MTNQIIIPIHLTDVELYSATSRGSEFASGFDLRANLAVFKHFEKLNEDRPFNYRVNDGTIYILPGCTILIPTGIRLAIPVGFELQVRPRSGLALKNNIFILNTPGTVDADYRGEVCVILKNLGILEFKINHGDRIAQAVVAPVIMPIFKQVSTKEELPNSNRGDGGFGSSGTK